jgi:hypothetical protein
MVRFTIRDMLWRTIEALLAMAILLLLWDVWDTSSKQAKESARQGAVGQAAPQ